MNVIDDLNAIAQNAQTSQAILGTVTAIDTVNASLTVQTSAPDPITGIRWLAHYAPTVNDFVVLMRAGSGWWVIGKNSKDLRTGQKAYSSAEFAPTAIFESHAYVAEGMGSWDVSESPQIGKYNTEPGMPSQDEAYAGLWRLSGVVPAGAVITSAKLMARVMAGWEFGYETTFLVSTHTYAGTPSFPPTLTNTTALDPFQFEAQPREYVFDLPSTIATALVAGTAQGVHIAAPSEYGLVVVENLRVVIEYYTGA